MLYKSQHAYLKGRGTHTAIFEFTEKILQELEEKNQVMGLFLDLTKAYDCVNHKILLKKLERYGVAGVLLAWLGSYMSGRLQQTAITKEGISYTSSKESVEIGIQQGSILSPILFIIYINDAPISVANLNCFLCDYADDKNILVAEKDLNAALTGTLNKIYEALSNWISNEGLLLNHNKTDCVFFKTRRSNVDCPDHISLNGVEIGVSTEARLLGMTIDETLSWEVHIDKLAKKLNSVCYTLRVMSQYLNVCGLKMIYSSCFEAPLRYGVVFYGSVRASDIIFRTQKRAIRIINKLSFRASCRGFFRSSEKNLPSHSYNSRSCNFVYPIHRLTVTEKGAKYACMKLFNRLPLRFKQMDNKYVFRRELHKLLIELEPYTVLEYLNASL
ncbi:uncharacterized protein LOC123307144 [Coccinella septempunctata]|uniref:uncharacterized protein LOC123307144 n=1 Tax=Coccinella septempunctata TaxID=41139 RepID=UPI001D080614|nr:uncharacterized protein LOC123307144 [Coccinella septempunctata]